MADLDSVCAACGILVDPEATAGFTHVGTAFSVAPGEWLSVWTARSSEASEDHDEPAPASIPASLRLMDISDGSLHELRDIECDGDIMGFRSDLVRSSLDVAEDGQLRKRARLEVIGYPSVISHPAFNLHRGSLTGERYLPYCCPWAATGHVALYTVDNGWISTRSYHGMQGSPVFGVDDTVVGVLADSVAGPDQLPLSRFVRLG